MDDSARRARGDPAGTGLSEIIEVTARSLRSTRRAEQDSEAKSLKDKDPPPDSSAGVDTQSSPLVAPSWVRGQGKTRDVDPSTTSAGGGAEDCTAVARKFRNDFALRKMAAGAMSACACDVRAEGCGGSGRVLTEENSDDKPMTGEIDKKLSDSFLRRCRDYPQKSGKDVRTQDSHEAACKDNNLSSTESVLDDKTKRRKIPLIDIRSEVSKEVSACENIIEESPSFSSLLVWGESSLLRGKNCEERTQHAQSVNRDDAFQHTPREAEGRCDVDSIMSGSMVESIVGTIASHDADDEFSSQDEAAGNPVTDEEFEDGEDGHGEVLQHLEASSVDYLYRANKFKSSGSEECVTSARETTGTLSSESIEVLSVDTRKDTMTSSAAGSNDRQGESSPCFDSFVSIVEECPVTVEALEPQGVDESPSAKDQDCEKSPETNSMEDSFASPSSHGISSCEDPAAESNLAPVHAAPNSKCFSSYYSENGSCSVLMSEEGDVRQSDCQDGYETAFEGNEMADLMDPSDGDEEREAGVTSAEGHREVVEAEVPVSHGQGADVTVVPLDGSAMDGEIECSPPGSPDLTEEGIKENPYLGKHGDVAAVVDDEYRERDVNTSDDGLAPPVRQEGSRLQVPSLSDLSSEALRAHEKTERQTDPPGARLLCGGDATSTEQPSDVSEEDEDDSCCDKFQTLRRRVRRLTKNMEQLRELVSFERGCVKKQDEEYKAVRAKMGLPETVAKPTYMTLFEEKLAEVQQERLSSARPTISVREYCQRLDEADRMCSDEITKMNAAEEKLRHLAKITAFWMQTTVSLPYYDPPSLEMIRPAPTASAPVDRAADPLQALATLATEVTRKIGNGAAASPDNSAGSLMDTIDLGPDPEKNLEVLCGLLKRPAKKLEPVDSAAPASPSDAEGSESSSTREGSSDSSGIEALTVSEEMFPGPSPVKLERMPTFLV